MPDCVPFLESPLSDIDLNLFSDFIHVVHFSALFPSPPVSLSIKAQAGKEWDWKLGN